MDPYHIHHWADGPRHGTAAATEGGHAPGDSRPGAAFVSGSRRRFLGGSVAGLAGALAVLRSGHARPATAPDRLHLQDCRIAGSRHYDCHAQLERLRPGAPLTLHREPDNRHDRRAVEVFWRGRKLGHLPRQDSAAAASLLERGHAVSAEILRVEDPSECWEPLEMRLWVGRAPSRGRTLDGIDG